MGSNLGSNATFEQPDSCQSLHLRGTAVKNQAIWRNGGKSFLGLCNKSYIFGKLRPSLRKIYQSFLRNFCCLATGVHPSNCVQDLFLRMKWLAEFCEKAKIHQFQMSLLNRIFAMIHYSTVSKDTMTLVLFHENINLTSDPSIEAPPGHLVDNVWTKEKLWKTCHFSNACSHIWSLT